MYKHFTNNAKKAVTLIKKNGKADLKVIPATKLIEAILQRKGSYGKNIINSLAPEAKEEIIQKLKNGSSLTAAELVSEAGKLAYLTKSHLIGTEHIVQAFIEKELNLSQNSDVPNGHPGEFPPVPKEMQREINNLLNDLFPQNTESGQHNILKLYCSDLHVTTKEQPPLVGKTDELTRLTHILARKNKNNPILLGDPGVGKTAIVEGLAKNINNLNVPEHLINKKILSLDLSQLVAGTSFRGEFESRLKEIMYVLEQDKNIILFIDEIHMLMGAGNSVGGMDAANILKPALSRGTIQIIGATTVEEYKKSIAKDSALERRFQPLIVPEADQEETIQILKGIQKYYEEYHQASFSKESVINAAKLAKKYITNRFLPDSAIDLLDETAARKRSQLIDNPKYKKYIVNKHKLGELNKLKESLLMSNNYEEALQLKANEKKLKKLLKEEKEVLQSKKISRKITVDNQDILDTLSLITNISPKLLRTHNSDLAKQIKKTLGKKLIGQGHIKKNIHETILRRLSGLSRQRGPLGSFIFIGPSGVGKTMTAKLLAQAISPTDQPSLIQINMSEFTEKHTISRLLGAPAGYVGHENEGELSAKIYRNPFSVILFDEIEKADPGILNILLQILEEGELVDARNKKVDFKNTLVILTSNIGTEALNYLSNIGFTSSGPTKTPNKKQIKESILEELQEQLPAELLARLDSTLIFNNLERKDIQKIVRLFLADLKRKLKKKQVSLTFDNKVVDFLTDKSLILNQGARLVRKNIQDLVEPILAKELLKKNPSKNIKLSLNKQGNKVVILK